MRHLPQSPGSAALLAQVPYLGLYLVLEESERLENSQGKNDCSANIFAD